jgi:hypothetical protein
VRPPTRHKPSPKQRCPKGTNLGDVWLANQTLSGEILDIIKNNSEIAIVKYNQCQLEVLAECSAMGQYKFTKTNRAQVTTYILNKEVLFKKLPFDAPTYEKEFGENGTMSLQTAIVGHYDASTANIEQEKLSGYCDGATHFIKTAQMGAFRLQTKTVVGDHNQVQLLAAGGVHERCLISTTDARSAVCESVLKMNLVPIITDASMPKSDPHPLFGKFPGTSRIRRLETDQQGKSIEIPAPQKATLLVFWDPASKHSPKVMAKIEQIAQNTDPERIQIVAVATNTHMLFAQNKIREFSNTFPLAIDLNETLAKRFVAKDRLPCAFIVDRDGYVQFFADLSRGKIGKLEALLHSIIVH